MNTMPGMEAQIQDVLTSVVPTTLKIITNPVDFYRNMRRTGGFVEPLIYMIILGVAAGLLRCLLGLFGMGMVGTAFAALGMIIIYPILAALFGFIMGGILFAIWKVIGSEESYETAYRCGAYMAAIAPITTLFSLIPYLGTLISLGWTTYLLVVASIEVHRIEDKKAWMVFGIIGGILALMSISSEMAAKRFSSDADRFRKQMDTMQELSPEEAGKRVGEFLKGIEQGTGKGSK
jgi:hypothetical protein